jgi:Uma2 family endonuclease
MTVTSLMTADELLQMPDDGYRYELVRGELRKMSPAGADHGDVSAAIIASLRPYARERRLGKVFSTDTGFRVGRNPDTVRAPDAAFVRRERVVKTAKFFEGPPDIVFEVVSPNDSYTEVGAKTDEWLRAGVHVVVIVDPQRERVTIHRTNATEQVSDAIAIEDLVPGWRLPLAELFDDDAS